MATAPPSRSGGIRPAVSIAVGTRSLIEQLVPDALRLVSHGLLSLETTQLITDAELRPAAVPTRLRRAVKLTLYAAAARSADCADALDAPARLAA